MKYLFFCLLFCLHGGFTHAAASKPNLIVIFTSDNGAPLKISMEDAPMRSGPDAKQIATGGWDGSINILPHLKGEVTAPPHEAF